jgi:hypothetical protein
MSNSDTLELVIAKAGTTTKMKTKISMNIELKMVINTFVLFIAMAFKSVFFILLVSSNFTGVSPFTVFLYATDIFSLLSPLLLVFSSSHVRNMLKDFILRQRTFSI